MPGRYHSVRKTEHIDDISEPTRTSRAQQRAEIFSRQRSTSPITVFHADDVLVVFFNEAPAGKKHLAGRAGLSANPSKAYFETLIRSHRRLMFYILGRARRVFFLYAGFANPSPLGATLISRSDSTGVRQMGHLLDWCRSIRAHPLHMHM